MTRTFILSGLLLAVSVLAAVPGIYQHYITRTPAAAAAPVSVDDSAQLVEVGSHDLGGAGFNADVWVHGDFAYVGEFGTVGKGGCLGAEVKVLDISEPTAPVLVESLRVPFGVRASDVKAASLNTQYFQGDLLVVSNEACLVRAGGIQLWDVTNPRAAMEVGRFTTGRVHNTFVFQQGERAYVFLAVSFAEVFGASNGFPASDLQIVDVTDPADPFLAAQWTIGRDAGLEFGICSPPGKIPLCRGDDASVNLHDMWVSDDGTLAYLSYWDAGLVILDVSDATNPTLLGRGDEPPLFGSDEGNAHHAVPVGDSGLVLVADEDRSGPSWGALRVFDASNPTDPVQIGAFATDNALANPPPDAGWYSMHNAFIDGGLAYLAYYSDGVRVLDLADPTAPKEIAAFLPPETADPFDFFPPRAIWGVYVRDSVVFASDVNSGLHVLAFDHDLDGCADLQETGDNALRGGQRDPNSFWDFFDTPNAANRRDRAVSAADLVRVVARFGGVGDKTIDPLSPPGPAPAYHTAFDRTPAGDAPNGAAQGPDGSIAAQDIALAVAQFGHTCA